MDEQKFYLLDYTHEELEALLDKINDGYVLTQAEYDKLINQIGLENISTFDGKYSSLIGAPEIPDAMSDLVNDLEFQTIDQVNAKILAVEQFIENKDFADKKFVQDAIADAQLDNGEVDIDLSEYAKVSYVDEQIAQIDLIPGPKGDKGDKGDQGIQGPQGPAGTFNENAKFANLETVNKTIIGAINELFALINNMEIPEPEEPEVTATTMYYGFVPYSVMEMAGASTFEDMTLNILKDENSSIVETEVPVVKQSIGVAPESSYILVAVPKASGYIGQKDNGLGGAVPFDESVLGVNGAEVMFNNVPYLVFGELALVSGERFIYIQ